MPKNPLSDKQFSKLKKSIEWSEQQLQLPRRKRLEGIKQYVGYHYASNGSQLRVPVPMMALAIQIYIRNLAAQNPRVLIDTQDVALKPTAASLELAVNMIPDEINLGATMRRWVAEALFSIGVVRVGLVEVGNALGLSYGDTSVDNITLDDYFLDMSAKSQDLISYEGHTYWMDFEEYRKAFDDIVDKSELAADDYTTLGTQGEQTAPGISADGSAEQYRERIHLRDTWLPLEGKVITTTVKSNKLVRVIDWTGPRKGMYIKLGYSPVPGNLLPLPPVALWRDLHELSNTIFRKLGAEAEAQKSVLGFQGGDDTNVNNFKNARDGDGINYQGAPPVPMSAGGVDPKSMAFWLQCRDLFSYYAGNLDNLGGLNNSAPTLGQDRLLSAAAGAQMQDMADMTAKAMKDVFHHLAFYEWNDPIKTRTLEKPIPGTDMNIPVEWNQQAKQGNFEDYSIDIDVYSLSDNAPGVRLQKLGAVVQQYILPMAPMIQQAGGVIDVQKILKQVAKYSNLPELEDVVTFSEPISNGSEDMQRNSASSPVTSHTSTRVGQPGMSREGSTASMMQQLMSGGESGMASGSGG